MSRYPWRELKDELIPTALRASDPVAALEDLYRDSGQDGMVAEALGGFHETHGDLANAVDWYRVAEARFWDERWKDRLRRSLARVEADLAQTPRPERVEVTRDPGPADGTDTLYIVSCSRNKVWMQPHARGISYVPAALAYTGQWIERWRTSEPAADGARWLIMSAKYGFIEPDHPIAPYDVTFGDASTGPIDDASLTAQVMHQTRWADALPLRAFRRVVVFGSPEYVRRTQAAFAHATSDVRPWRGGAREPSADPGPAERRRVVADLLAGLGPLVLDAADRNEPEWPVLEHIAGLEPGVDVLITLALALSNYNLGSDTADRYWLEAQDLLDRETPVSAGDVARFSRALMRRPVAARDATTKIARIDRLVASAIPSRVSGGVASLDAHAVTTLWRDLAALFGGPDRKTVVFAIKTLGLLHLCDTARRMPLPAGLPIPVDRRIARLSLAAGLLVPPDGRDLPAAMSAANEIAEHHRDTIILIWRDVADLAGTTSAELDSLLWQVAGQLRHARPPADVGVAEVLTHLGVPPATAQDAARVLTHAL